MKVVILFIYLGQHLYRCQIILLDEEQADIAIRILSL